jgi:hypothetical protein
MAQIRSGRLDGAAGFLLLLLLVVSCKRESRDGERALTTSLIFDNTSPEAREALSAPIDFRINEDNFARWSEAQSNLEELPRSAINGTVRTGSNAVDRAIARLESSPRARRAIERAGLSVRDYVLETIALAQATEAAQTGRSLSPAPIPPENSRFVQRYAARVLRARAAARVARAEEESYDMQSDTADEMTNQTEMDMQMHLKEAEHEVEGASTRDSSRGSSRDSSRGSSRDSVRDSVPTLR